jgi:hypothetical protein
MKISNVVIMSEDNTLIWSGEGCERLPWLRGQQRHALGVWLGGDALGGLYAGLPGPEKGLLFETAQRHGGVSEQRFCGTATRFKCLWGLVASCRLCLLMCVRGRKAFGVIDRGIHFNS